MSDEAAPVEVVDGARDADAPDGAPPPGPDAPYRVLHLESVLYDLADPSPFVHLQEAESPYRYLAIPVAPPDAAAIHAAHIQLTGRRPTTHELLATALARARVDVVAARIVRYEGGVFFAEVDLMTPHGREVLDCRTSDALALALRQSVPAPILCAEEVLQAYYS
jgi:bifunctional DNase/RNase